MMKVGQIASFGTKKGDKIRGQPEMMEERVERDLEHPFPSPGMKPSITSGLALGRTNPRIQRAKCKIQGHLREKKSSRTLRMKQDPLDRTLLETVLSTVLLLQMLATPTHPAHILMLPAAKTSSSALIMGFMFATTVFPALRDFPNSDTPIGLCYILIKQFPSPLECHQWTLQGSKHGGSYKHEFYCQTTWAQTPALPLAVLRRGYSLSMPQFLLW